MSEDGEPNAGRPRKQRQAAPKPPPTYLRVSDVVAMLQVSERTLRRMVRDGRFPKPVMFSSQMKVWRVSDYRAWEQGIQPN